MAKIRGLLQNEFGRYKELLSSSELAEYEKVYFSKVLNGEASVVVNDSVKRDALTREQERKFLQFIQEDRHYSRYHEAFFILFKTGLRISEFCGLTIKDIDFKKNVIQVNHQESF